MQQFQLPCDTSGQSAVEKLKFFGRSDHKRSIQPAGKSTSDVRGDCKVVCPRDSPAGFSPSPGFRTHVHVVSCLSCFSWFQTFTTKNTNFTNMQVPINQMHILVSRCLKKIGPRARQRFPSGLSPGDYRTTGIGTMCVRCDPLVYPRKLCVPRVFCYFAISR